MIIFGTRGKVVAGPQVEGMECANCGERTHSMFGILRYFHIFWIPVFPTKKQPGVECLHCKQTLLGKELPGDLSKEIRSQVFSRKAVLPMFTGLAIIAVLLLGGYGVSQEGSRRDASYLESPLANDYYIVKLTKMFNSADSKYPYGVMKVNRVLDDRLEMLISTYGYNLPGGARKAIRKGQTENGGYYLDKPVYIETVRLKSLKEQGIIYSVLRN